MRPRSRRPARSPTLGETWGYSATIPAAIEHPIPAPAHADAQPVQRDRPGRADPAAKEVPPKPEVEQANKDDRKDDRKDGTRDEAAPKKRMPAWKKALYLVIGLVVLAGLIVAGTLYYLHARHYENTDDAFIDGHMSQVSAQVAARVISLEVQDNQFVAVNQVLLRLDPRDYQVKLDTARAQRAQAAAQVSQAQAQLALQQANLDQAQAQVRISEADLGQQQTDLARYRAIDPKAITRQQLDTSSAQTKSAAARLDASKQAVEGARATLVSQLAQIEAAKANLAAADVAVANAELQLSYTTVTAPVAGRFTKRTVEVGNYVNPGQSLLAVVPDDNWITANFKETQLADMRLKQPVLIHIDACPGHDFEGSINSIQSGTGSVFSALPPENATGNYVKVVQRVPVKIVFKDRIVNGRLGATDTYDGCEVFPGLSVSPRVTVR